MEFNELLYNHQYPENPRCGSLLIAEPLMQEGVFSRSVVMVLDEDKSQGHLGLELNKQLKVSLNTLIPDLETERELPVFSGGPVDQSRLFMLHTLGDMFEGSTELFPGIYVGGKIEEVYEYLMTGGETEGKIRFFLGYSGWVAGQLKNEIDKNVWALTNDAIDDPERLLTGRGNSYWRREVKRLGSDYRSWLIVPQNPLMN